MADSSARKIGVKALNEIAVHPTELEKGNGGIDRFRGYTGLWAIRGLEALEFLERSSEIANDPVIAC
ncbi:MAG: hypothetical protein ACJ8R9_33920 [Steroidobacteraceae bacterium]